MEIQPDVLDTFFKARRGRGEGARSFGAFTATTLRDPSLGPQPFPAPRRDRGLTLSRRQAHPRGLPTLLASPPEPQEGGSREPSLTENSHFLAARLRTTPGLIPSDELCNQGHHSRAKQTRLCVHQQPRGRARQQGGAPTGPRGRTRVLRESRRGTLASAPRRQVPAQRRAQPLPHRGRPRLQAPNLVPSPDGRVTARRLSDLGFGGPCEVLDSSPGLVPDPDLSSALSPRCQGSRKVTTPPPNSGGDARSDSRLERTPLTAPGGWRRTDDSCADGAPPPRASRPRAAPKGVWVHPARRA